MRTSDNLNFFLDENDSVVSLLVTDVIKPGDYVRSLSVLDSELNFKPTGWNPYAWHPVESELTAWVGKTYLDLIEQGVLKDAGLGPGEAVNDYVMHELIRVTPIKTK
jgi:hypothetical protein